MKGLIYVCERELKIWVRNPWLMAVILIAPAFQLGLFSVGLSGLVSGVPIGGVKVHYFYFFGLGMASALPVLISLAESSSVFVDRSSGFLEEMLASPLRMWEITFGKAIAISFKSFLPSLIIALIVATLSKEACSLALLPLAALILLITSLVTSFASVSLVLLLRSEGGYNLLFNMLQPPLFYLRSAFYPLDALPPPLRLIASVNPVTAASEAVRHLLFVGQAPLGYLATLSLYLSLTLILTALTSKRLKP